MRPLRWMIVAALVLLPSMAFAGGHWNEINRKLGLGWSDGYHARSGWTEAEWVRTAPVAPAKPPAPVMKTEKPSSRRNEIVLPSQRAAQRPAYWK